MFEDQNVNQGKEELITDLEKKQEDKNHESNTSLIRSPERKVKNQDFNEINPIVFDRAKRNIDFANSLKDLKEKNMTDKDFVIAKSVLERRSWAKIINNLNLGDQVLTILTPSTKLLSIKNLNDNIFGPQRTDTIIEKRREYASQAFNLKIKELIAQNNLVEQFSDLDVYSLNLEQNFKYGVYKIPQKIAELINLQELMNFIYEEVNKKMTAEIQREINFALEDARRDLNEEKIDAIEYFKSDFEKDGFHLDCGISKVEDDNLKAKVLSLAQSLQAAKINHFKADGKSGRIFKESEFQESIKRIGLIRNEIVTQGNEIINKDGYRFKIFLKSEGDKFKMNKNLLRDVRKEKFDPQDDFQREILKKLLQYQKLLNIIDFIKPFPSDEEDNFKEELREINKLKVALNQRDEKKYLQIKEKLESNEKDKHFTSNQLFESESIQIDNCSYLNLDVLDLGVDQLLRYEELLQDFSHGKKSIQEISLEADDLITKRLQEIRAKIVQIVSSYQNGILLNKDDLVVASIGGDEIVLAIDNQKINEQDLNKMIFTIKKATNTRVMKTIIVQTKRVSDSNDPDIRLKEHLMAINRSEKGIEAIKVIESEFRKYKVFLQNSDLYLNNFLDIDKRIKEDLKDIALDSLIALEDEDQNIVFKSNIDERLYTQSEILNKFKKLKKKYNKGGKDAQLE